MTSATKRKPAGTMTEREMGSLLVRYDLAPTDDNVAMLMAYRKRTHSAHWWGVIGALVAGGAGLLGSTGDSLGLNLTRILIGYLLGATMAEVFSPQRRTEGAVHTASLVTRQPDQLVPRWARVVPWLTLVPCLAAPLLILGDHPTGKTRVHDHTGSAMATASWFSTPVLITSAVLAAAGLVLWRLALHRLVRRRLPADRPGAARLDLLTRAFSARSIAGTATALGLLLLSGLAYLSGPPLNSRACTSVYDCHYLYAWHGHLDLLNSFGGLAGLSAIFVFLTSRIRSRVNPALLGPVTEPAA